MNILIAPDSFKGSAASLEVGDALREGILQACPGAAVRVVPLADGGEGTVDALVAATAGKYVTAEAIDPLGRPIKARYGILGDGQSAVIEAAAASGLVLLTETERDASITSTYGTGQLIRHALDQGCRHLIIGLGGSATNDGGAGLVQALGAKLLDEWGNELPVGGLALAKLAHIDLSGFDARMTETTVQVACDVTKPLCGPEGATYIFGPQKGIVSEA
ncbi:MAG: glycerate kinase, partial [Bacilli bacterium]|nr:glycerate kinase [Bacilli bacterium]